MISTEPTDSAGHYTLAELVIARGCERPSDTAFVFADFSPAAVADPSYARQRLSYGDLLQQAQAVAQALRDRALTGRPVLLMFPSGLDFIRAYLGCMLAGAVSVPVRVPLTSHDQKQCLSIAVDCGAEVLLCSGKLAPLIHVMRDSLPALRGLEVLSFDQLDLQCSVQLDAPAARDTQTAMLQYTSGSTGAPKGVVITHENLLANQRAIKRGFRHDTATVVVGWLPMFHDMGLIGNVLQPLYLGVPGVLMDPLAFVQRPLRWLQLITEYNATTSGGPNFGFELCTRKIDETDKQQLDLSSWTLAFSGSEPVRAETLRTFSHAFASVGFRSQSFYPCYGLAESTLFVSGSELASAPRGLRVDAGALAKDRVVEASAPTSSFELISCGKPQAEQVVLIVDPQSRHPLPEDQVGEIWLAGPSTAQGYLGKPELNREVFGATLDEASTAHARSYLRTGDLGFLHDGSLYVSGRLKDLMIVRGRNHYPQDVEATAEKAHEAIRAGCSVAFSFDREGVEAVVLVVELKLDSAPQLDSITADIRQAVTRDHGLSLHDVLFVAPRSVPKTSSGKQQRRQTRALYEQGAFTRLRQSIPVRERV